MPRWNEGGYGAGQYDAGPPSDVTTTVTHIDTGGPAYTTAHAILNYWTASNLPSITSDGYLWYGEAPSQPITPYAVLILVTEPEVNRTTGSVFFEATYQINCMHDLLSGAEEMARTVWDAFEGAPLVLNNNPVLFCLSGQLGSRIGKGMGIDGKDCWISFIEIEILYVK